MAVDDTTLGCGRTIDQVWANIDGTPTPHETGCEQCRAARDSLRTLQRLTVRHRTAERAAETDPDDFSRPRPSVRSTVLSIARAEVRRGRRIPVTTTGLGPILISEQTLLALVRTAVDTVTGVRARRVSTTGLAATDAESPDTAGKVHDVRITCRVAVAPGMSIPAAAASARDRVVAATTRHLRLDPEAVDIIVEDLYDR